ncbi:hypothetical protein TNCV_4682311 [Trichonephila clavipes]|nr:hypothetical protein TNCV_4682311 [Trichonephila clavipes]
MYLQDRFGRYRSIESTKTDWNCTRYSIITCFAQTSDSLARLTQTLARMPDVMDMRERNIKGIWILTDSRDSIHASRWTTVGDMAIRNILDHVVRLSSRHLVHFQLIPPRIGLNGNEIADSLHTSASADTLRGNTCLTFTEHSPIKRVELNALLRIFLLTLGILGKNPMVLPT